jgi:hypothetical protein
MKGLAGFFEQFFCYVSIFANPVSHNVFGINAKTSNTTVANPKRAMELLSR